MSNDECPGRIARWGFTWIEWLVIIGIIAILASLVFPTLAQTRRKIIRIACVSSFEPLTPEFCTARPKA